MDTFRSEQNKKVGGGGIFCPCCNKYFKKDKAMLNRLVRARLKRDLEKDVKNVVTDTEVSES